MEEIKAYLFNKMKLLGRIEEITANFKVMDTDDLRVAVALGVFETFDIMPLTDSCAKNAKLSIDFRSEANRIFVTSKYDVVELLRALHLYSRSIALAPNGSQEKSLAYANRSALLHKLEKYDECIQDINRALELNYPKHLIGKLHRRRVECFAELNQNNKMNYTVQEVSQWLKEISLSADVQEKLENKLALLEKSANSTTKTCNKQSQKKLPNFVRNEKIPCASEGLTINYDEKFGRHIVTTRKINSGEILIAEKPYATVLIPDEIYSHCSQCLQVHFSMIPCDDCIYAMYCSQDCKRLAWEQYHKEECNILGYMINLGFSKNELLSLRLAIMAVKKAGSIRKLREELGQADNCEDPCRKGFSEDSLYKSDKYSTLYTLITNVEKRSAPDLFERALKAAIILFHLCAFTGLFGKVFELNMQNISSDIDATYVGGLILRNLQIIPSNMHSIEEMHRLTVHEIGVAALPFCSLINHSCDPNVSRLSSKDYMVIFALVPIPKGAQIFDNYGCLYAVNQLEERELKLKQYYFKCKCLACEENWPLYQHLRDFSEIITDKDILKKLNKTFDKLNMYIEDVTKQKPNLFPLTKDLSRMIETAFKLVPMSQLSPCVSINNAVETLKSIMSVTYGNVFSYPKLPSNLSL